MPVMEAMEQLIKDNGALQHKSISLKGGDGGGTHVLKARFLFETPEARRKAVFNFEAAGGGLAGKGYGSAALKIGDDELEIQITHDEKERLQRVKTYLQGHLSGVGSQVP